MGCGVGMLPRSGPRTSRRRSSSSDLWQLGRTWTVGTGCGRHKGRSAQGRFKVQGEKHSANHTNIMFFALSFAMPGQHRKTNALECMSTWLSSHGAACCKKNMLVGTWLVLCFQRFASLVHGPRSFLGSRSYVHGGQLGLHSAHHALPPLPPCMVAEGRRHDA